MTQIEVESTRTLVAHIRDIEELRRLIKKGNRISFISHVVYKQSDGNKHKYKHMVDRVIGVYPNFVRTEKKYCVQYADIIAYGV